jgi:Putative mono-oxygenase ydhR
MWVLLVLYKSALPIEDVLDLFKKRMRRYRKVKGLLQKLYIHDEATGHVGGVYVFDSKKNLDAFQASDLAKGIGNAYRFVEPPTKRAFKVTDTLFIGKKPPA